MSEAQPYDDEQALAAAATVLGRGELVVAPVGGVYAVLADAFDGDATAALRSARGAVADAPLTLCIRSHKQLPGVTRTVPEPAERLVAAFWPGPLTLLLRAAETIAVDLGATRGTVAVCWPAEEPLNELIGEIGPLACSAAARVGEPTPRDVTAAQDALGDAVACYLDGGHRDGVRSTVVDCTRGGAEVVRRGAISADDVLDAATGALGWGAPPAATSASGAEGDGRAGAVDESDRGQGDHPRGDGDRDSGAPSADRGRPPGR